MTEESPFVVIAQFRTEVGQQAQALQEIGAYVDEFLRLQDGFLGSELLQDGSGTAVVHVARWRSEPDFRAFAAQAQSHPDLPKLRRYQPVATFHSVWQRYQPPG